MNFLSSKIFIDSYNKSLSIFQSRLQENTIRRVEDISRDDIRVSDYGLTLLKSGIDEINKKAAKWGLEPVEVKILRTEKIKNADADYVTKGEFTIYHVVHIEGRSPQVEGYEFIAKIEHTDAGNLINIAPNSSIKDLPNEYREANPKCDVCKSNRERFNTFIIKDEKNNQLMTVGSSCLKRFLPIDSVNKLIRFAEMIEDLRQVVEDSEENENDQGISGPNKYKNHYGVDTLLVLLAGAYLATGKYMSNSKAKEIFNTTGNVETSTSELAQHFLEGPSKDDNEHERALYDRFVEKKDEAVALGKEALDWMKAQDWKAFGDQKPEMKNFFDNVAVISKSDTIKLKNIAYLGGGFSMFLRTKNMAANKKPAGQVSNFVGKVGEKVSVKAILEKKREFQSDFGVTTLYSFRDESGNAVSWFSSRDIGIEEGKTYNVTGTVKKQEVSKYTRQPETYLTRAKISDESGTKLNENDGFDLVKQSLSEAKYDYETYHDRLDQALDEVNKFIETNKIVLAEPDSIQKAFQFGGVNYGETKDAHAQITSINLKPTKKYLHVTLYRIESGRYELTIYIL